MNHEQEREQELRDLIDVRLIPGFASFDDIEADVTDWAADEGVAVEPAVRQVHERWEARLAEQAAWHDTGDFGRLSAAFAELEAAGILARMNFTCCSRCATTEIDGERTPLIAESDGYPYREWAYVYFHEQDAERLAEPLAELFLGFGTFGSPPHAGDRRLDSTDAETVVGQQIVDALRRFGLTVRWTGHRTERIVVTIDEWRKPLPQ